MTEPRDLCAELEASLSSHKVRHPAKYSDALLPVIREAVQDWWLGYCDLDDFRWPVVLDPFGGVGKIHGLALLGVTTVSHELEWEWVVQGKDQVNAANGVNVQGNALQLPFRDGCVDVVVTSPTYGNRMADKHNARDGSRRNTYTHAMGRKLHEQNSGTMQWGKAYREFHWSAWKEVVRVLRPGGLFVLNVSDHVRKEQIVGVSRWHRLVAERLGLELTGQVLVETPRLRFGENHGARVDGEMVYSFVKPKGD